MIRGSVLLFALLLNARVIWQALAEQSTSLESATIHYLITVPIVAVLFGLLRLAARRPRSRRQQPQRPADNG